MKGAPDSERIRWGAIAVETARRKHSEGGVDRSVALAEGAISRSYLIRTRARARRDRFGPPGDPFKRFIDALGCRSREELAAAARSWRELPGQEILALRRIKNRLTPLTAITDCRQSSVERDELEQWLKLIPILRWQPALAKQPAGDEHQLSRPKWGVTEDVLARSLFGPLGGIVEIGAVAAAGTWDLTDVSVDDFVLPRQGDIARLLAVVQEVGDFGESIMGIFDELGYLREHPVEAPNLLMWSSGYGDVRDPFNAPDAVRRMSRTGADLQLTRFLQALVNAAIARGPEVTRGTALIAEALRITVRLVGGAMDEDEPDSARGAMTVFRIWRVTFLADLLLPTSSVRPEARSLFRKYGRALEELLGA